MSKQVVDIVCMRFLSLRKIHQFCSSLHGANASFSARCSFQPAGDPHINFLLERNDKKGDTGRRGCDGETA